MMASGVDQRFMATRSTKRGFRYRGGLRLIGLLLFVLQAAYAADPGWDVNHTGEPGTDVDFTVTAGTWMSLDVSPDGRQLLFDILGDLYSLPASGGEATLVAGGPAMQRQPRFSPDGTKILFVSDASGGDNLWVADASGANARQITHETVDGLSSPAWSPDGEYVIAQKNYSRSIGMREGAEIWMFHLGGGSGRVLVPALPTKMTINEPAFSPDGAALFYTEDVMPRGARFRDPNQINFAIKRRDLASGEVAQILSGFGSATTPEISRDGKRIAFIRRVKTKTVLFVYDSITHEQRPVFDGLDRDDQSGQATFGYYPQFAWFPDGRDIAIWARGKLLRVNTHSASGTEIPFKAHLRHRLTQPPRFENDLDPEHFTVRAIRQIAVSPDGGTVVFNALGQLWRKQLPDAQPERLTSDADLEFEPVFSPDGRQLAYVRWNDERGSALRVLSIKSGKARTLVESKAPILAPSFSSDGRKLVYVVQKATHLMGGYRAEPGIHWIAVEGGAARRVIEEGADPQFSSDGTRIYYTVAVTPPTAAAAREYKSVRLDGTDARSQVRAGAGTAFRLSPDGRWLAFREHFKYFVIPYRETGIPLNVGSVMKGLPIATLTQQAGYDLTWSADSRTVHWLLGDEVFSAQIDRQFTAAAIRQGQGVRMGLVATPDRPKGVVAFVNGRIITMQGEQVIENGTLVVTDNRITAVGPSSSVSVPAGAKIIDALGKTVMPGLIDMHGHLGLFQDELTPQKHANHYAALAFGVTTNFDPNTSDQAGFSMAEMTLAGRMAGPRSLSVGTSVYGRQGMSLYVPIDNLDDARDLAARKKALGAVGVKSYRRPMRSQRQQLIKAAREAGLMVLPEGEAFYTDVSMILDGHISIEHSMPLANYYDDLVQLLAHGSTAITPTLAVFGENYFYQTTRPWEDPKVKTYVQDTLGVYNPLGGALVQPPYVRSMSSLHQAEEMYDSGFRDVSRAVKRLDEAGVIINAGGHGQLQGLSLHWELWLLAQGGWDNHRLLRTATINVAKTLGLDKQIGTLEVGKLADLIVLDANPLEDSHNTNSVRYTMVNGRLYDSLSMNEIGNYARPRGKFHWELPDYQGIEWNENWADDDPSVFGDTY